MVKRATCTNAMAGADPNSQYHLATDARMNALGECLFQISGQPAVNQKLPENKIQAQWDALSQDPEALMRISNKLGELRSRALNLVSLESSLFGAFYQRFVNETGRTLRLHQQAKIAEDARMKSPKVNWAHEKSNQDVQKEPSQEKGKAQTQNPRNSYVPC